MQDLEEAPPRSPIQQRVGDMLQEILTPLGQQREQLQALEADLSAQLADARSARQRIDSVLRQLVPKDKPAKKISRNGSSPGQVVAESKLSLIEQTIRSIGPECSPRQIKDELDRINKRVADPTLYSALTTLREQERIRAKPAPGGRKDARVYTAYEKDDDA